MKRADRSKLPEVLPPPPFRFPDIQKRRTSNGIDIWFAEHRSLPVVTVSLMLPAGSATDFEGFEGLAAITADLADEGTGNLSAIDVNSAFARIGAHLDTEVTADATFFSVTVLSKFVRPAMALMADCIARPRLDVADFDRVRQLRLTRLVQIRDMPSAIADRAFMQVVYGSHPYAHMALGTEESLRQLTLEGIRVCHARLYLPSHATLVAAGDMSADEFAACAADAFQGWPAPEDAPAPESVADIPPPALPVHRCVIVHKPGAAQAEIRIGHVGAPRHSPDYFPLIVLNMILGGQFVSRINMTLRQERGLTYGARTVFDFRRGIGPFMLQTSVQSDGTGEAVSLARLEIEAIRDGRPPTMLEVETAKAALTRGYARNFETADQIARAMVQLVLYGLQDDYFDRFDANVGDVTVERVADAARRHLQPEKLAAVVVADALVEGQLAQAGFGDPAPLLPRL